MYPSPVQIGQQIRRARLERGWSIDDMAARTGQSADDIIELECGNSKVTMAALTRVAAQIDIGIVMVPGEQLDAVMRLVAGPQMPMPDYYVPGPDDD